MPSGLVVSGECLVLRGLVLRGKWLVVKCLVCLVVSGQCLVPSVYGQL